MRRPVQRDSSTAKADDAVVNAYIAVPDLPSDACDWVMRKGMDIALETGQQVIVIGIMLSGLPALCVDGCARNTPGAVLLVPDLMALEAVANGHKADSSTLTRADGRSVMVFKIRTQS